MDLSLNDFDLYAPFFFFTLPTYYTFVCTLQFVFLWCILFFMGAY